MNTKTRYIRFTRELLIAVGCRSPFCYRRPQKDQEDVMPYAAIETRTRFGRRPTSVAATSGRPSLARGVLIGIALSLPVWIATAYVVFRLS
jgi:hypothetical protein